MSIPESIRVTIQASYKNLDIIGTYVHSILQAAVESKNVIKAEIPTLAFDIELAVHEVCNNIIEHSYGHENGVIVAYFNYESSRHCINVNLQDTGNPFDKTKVAPIDLGTAQTGGYGLFLIHQLMDEVIYTHTDTENHWHLIKFL